MTHTTIITAVMEVMECHDVYGVQLRTSRPWIGFSYSMSQVVPIALIAAILCPSDLLPAVLLPTSLFSLHIFALYAYMCGVNPVATALSAFIVYFLMSSLL